MSQINIAAQRACLNCLQPIDLKYGRFCDPCRAKRRTKPKKYQCTPRIDEAIRVVYLEHPKSRTLPGLAAIAQRLGWPKWAIVKRGGELGLARTKDKPWSDKELELIEKFAWMSDASLSLKLRRYGFIRSSTAVHLKLKRMRYRQNTPFYTANGLAQAFGIDSHAVLRWIKDGKLEANTRGYENIPNQRGDMWAIHQNDVHRFVRENPQAFDLRKVDQAWFMDLVFHGKIVNALSERATA